MYNLAYVWSLGIKMSLINALLQQSSASGSRSTTLKPLGWLVGLLLIATVGGATASIPEWLLMALAGFTGLSVFLYFGAYLYFMFKDPDALRSEKFNIEKMAIQKGITGDNESGVIEHDDSVDTANRSAEQHSSHQAQTLEHR